MSAFIKYPVVRYRKSYRLYDDNYMVTIARAFTIINNCLLCLLFLVFKSNINADDINLPWSFPLNHLSYYNNFNVNLS